MRNSTTAPYIIKVHDVKTPDATIRLADLWFVVYADLKDVDPAKAFGQGEQLEAFQHGHGLVPILPREKRAQFVGGRRRHG